VAFLAVFVVVFILASGTCRYYKIPTWFPQW